MPAGPQAGGARKGSASLSRRGPACGPLLALARALVGNPRFIVLDEPNANLDSDGDAALNNALVCLKAARVTVVIISHRSSILQHVDRILLLRDGQVEAFGPRAEILNRLMAQTGTSGPREAVSPAA